MSKIHSVAILGCGPAGLTSAIYTGRSQLHPIVFEGPLPGGQIIFSSEIENFPGFPQGISGLELVGAMRTQAEKFGAIFKSEVVEKIDFSSSPFSIYTTGGKEEYKSKTIIIATGAVARLLGVPGEKEYLGKGVSVCATCDGFFFRSQDVVVVGGGNTAVDEAIFLTNFANSVTLIHRRAELRATKFMQEKVFNNPKIKILWNNIVEEILGEPDKGVVGVRVKNVITDERRLLECKGVFVAIGHTPVTELFEGQLELLPSGHIKIDQSCKTSVEGVFACGDVADPVYRQAITACGFGCIAGLEVERYLQRLSLI